MTRDDNLFWRINVGGLTDLTMRCFVGDFANLLVRHAENSRHGAHAYRNREAAHDLVTDLDLTRAPCAGCDICTVTCVKGFDVRARIADVVRLRDVPREFLT